MSSDHSSGHGHHILSNATSRNVFFFLLFFTVITVVAAMFDFGSFNFTLAMLIATAKAMVVMLFFMGLKYDNNENRVIFFGSFVFFGFFIFYTAIDLFNRDKDWRATGSVYLESDGPAVPEFEFAWRDSEEIKAYGKQLFTEQACQTCHGDEGYGNGPAGLALGARNFHEAEGWKNGRKITQIYSTLLKGLGSMPAYANLQPNQKFALAQYIQSFGPPAPEAEASDFEAIGVNPELPDGGLGSGEEKKETIPIDFAVKLYADEL